MLKKEEKKGKSLIATTFFLICFIVNSVIMTIANQQFLSGMQEMGKEIPQIIVMAQEAYIQKNEALLKGIALKINEMKQEEVNSFGIEEMNNIVDKYGKVLGISNDKVYAVINGIFYSSEDIGYIGDYKKTEWYTKVMEAEVGEIVYTDVYVYNKTQENIVTIAMRTENNNIIAINLFPEEIDAWPNIEEFPDKTGYYVTDKNGVLIYQDNNYQEIEKENTQEYVDYIYSRLNFEKDEKRGRFILKQDNKKTGIYTGEMYNGWKVFVITPYENMMKGTQNVLTAYYISGLLFLVLIIYLMISERNENKQKTLHNRIVEALGDTYYAIYLLDLEKEQYLILKGSEYIKDLIPQRGSYSQFVQSFNNVMEKDVYEDFEEKFSINNIRKLVQNNVKSFGGDYKRKFKSGYRWVNIQMLYNEKKLKENQNQIIFAFQDIDERKEKELEEKQVLIESAKVTQLATRAKNKFFANISHDMRTPLNAIINLANMCDNQINNEEKLKDYLKKINVAGTQLLELINNILEISKIEADEIIVKKVETNITEKLKETISIFEEQAKMQNKKFKASYNIKHDYVICDWEKIRQIINNIISNAVKYTKVKGNITVEINEIVGRGVSKYEFKVTDDGIGMSEEFLQKIYIPFERETRFHSEDMSGTGLGMVIVKNNVQKLNGKIEIKSKADQGSEIYVVLPLKLSEESHNKDINEKQEVLLDLKGKKILIVEDNELNMEISTEVLEMQGANITQAWNGKQAVEEFCNSEEGYFDAILMDIQMPIMDGYEATRKIRSQPREDAKDITIIAVTASMFAEEIVEMEKAGMNDYVAKPIDFKEIQKALDKYKKG